jgi:5-methylcytosine-specific restriction protein A
MRKNEEPKRPHVGRKRHQPKTTTERGYGYDWQKLRSAWLNAEIRYCAICAEKGRIVPATVVDHIVPHAGNDLLRLSWDNLQGLCVSCHTWKTNTFDGGMGNERKPFQVKPVPDLQTLLDGLNPETKKG